MVYRCWITRGYYQFYGYIFWLGKNQRKTKTAWDFGGRVKAHAESSAKKKYQRYLELWNTAITRRKIATPKKVQLETWNIYGRKHHLYNHGITFLFSGRLLWHTITLLQLQEKRFYITVIVIVIPSFCWEIKPSAKFERQWLRLNHWGEKHLWTIRSTRLSRSLEEFWSLEHIGTTYLLINIGWHPNIYCQTLRGELKLRKSMKQNEKDPFCGVLMGFCSLIPCRPNLPPPEINNKPYPEIISRL